MGICLDTDANAAPDTEEDNNTWNQEGHRNTRSPNYSGRSRGMFENIDVANIGRIKFDPPKVPVIFVLGGPGSGKVTHCDTFMQERRGVTHINMMDLLQQYALGNDMQDFSLLSSKAVTEVLMLEMKMSPAAQAFLISGYPRSMRDVVEYSEKIQVVNGVVLISWRQAILQRQIDYGAKLGHVVLALAKMELENFFKNVMPVAEYFDQSDMLIAVNGERAPTEVYKDFRAAILDILSSLENPEAILNGVTGMGRGIHDIPGSIVSVETAPSQQPNIAEMPNATTYNTNHINNNQRNNITILETDEHDEHSVMERSNVISQQPTAVNLIPSMDAKPDRVPPIIWVLGGPGSNKATLCLKAVASNPGWAHISMGRIMRSITDSAPRANTDNFAIKEALSAGEMVPERLVNNLLDTQISQMAAHAGIVIDGYPRDLQQVKYFENKYKQLPPVILLDCSKLQLGRGRLDDSVPAFRRRLEVFRELTLPMLKAMDTSHRLQIVDGDTDSPAVQREFEQILRNHVQKLQYGLTNGAIPSEPSLMKNGKLPSTEDPDAILQDLENNAPEPVSTISHHVSMMNGYVKNRGTGSSNYNKNTVNPIQNGDFIRGNINFRSMLQEAERYPVDSYI